MSIRQLVSDHKRAGAIRIKLPDLPLHIPLHFTNVIFVITNLFRTETDRKYQGVKNFTRVSCTIPIQTYTVIFGGGVPHSKHYGTFMLVSTMNSRDHLYVNPNIFVCYGPDHPACNRSFTLPDSVSNLEVFPFGYKCYTLKVYSAQIHTRIPMPNGCIGNPSLSLSPAM